MPRPSTDSTVSLEACAREAADAFACIYSSSDEYNAAIIAERRAAGVYGPKRQRKQMVMAACGVAAGLAVIILAVQALS